MAEKAYSNHLWDKVLLCGTVFSDHRVKLLYVEGLLPATCAQVRNYPATHAMVDYQAVARYVQAIGEAHRWARRHFLPSNVASRDATGNIAFNRLVRRAPVLSVKSSSKAALSGAAPNADGILAMTSPAMHASTVSSPPASLHPSLVLSVRGTAAPTSTVPVGRCYGSGDHAQGGECIRAGPAWTPLTERKAVSLTRTPRCKIKPQQQGRRTIKIYAPDQCSAFGIHSVPHRDRFGEEIPHLKPHRSAWSNKGPKTGTHLPLRRRWISNSRR